MWLDYNFATITLTASAYNVSEWMRDVSLRVLGIVLLAAPY